MSWGSLRVGRTLLSETYSVSYQVNATTGEQSVALVGREMNPGLTEAQVVAREEDLIAMYDRSLPVTFSQKSTHDGFYEVKDVGAAVTKWPNSEAFFLDWNLSLIRVGPQNAVDQESRVQSVVRANDFALTGERWLGPPPLHYAFFTGSTTPSGSVDRPLANGEGTIKVYRGVPAGVNPRWGITPAGYLAGRARFLLSNIERTGDHFRIDDVTAWELQNGLVRVRPLTSGGLLSIDAWDGTTWDTKAWNIQVGTNITAFEAATVIRNDFEAVVLRLVDSKTPGRTMVDLTLRRGSRFVEVYVQTDTSATIGAHTQTNETLNDNSSAGWMRATAADAGGNRLVIGSARSFTADTTGGITKAAVPTMGFFIGVEVGAGSAPAGDLGLDLRNQYIAAMAETVQAVKR